MYYHGSKTNDLKVLEPRVSNHGIARVYFSQKRENILVYLSNAIEKYCKETGFPDQDHYTTWASYSFTKEGILRLEEYYPNATYDVYKGESGYIYSVKDVPNVEKQSDIPFAYHTTSSVEIDDCEFVPDAYEAIMQAVDEGKIVLQTYDEFIKVKEDWLNKIIKREYEKDDISPDYKYFLEAKFSNIIEKNSF